eukprot:15265529-Alexandrium_andersonii.AAC.1
MDGPRTSRASGRATSLFPIGMPTRTGRVTASRSPLRSRKLPAARPLPRAWGAWRWTRKEARVAEGPR